MKKKTWSRFLSLLLAAMMVVSCLPLTVLAAEGDGGATLHYLGLNDGGWIDSPTPLDIQLYNTDGSAAASITSGAKYGIVCNGKMMSSPYSVGANQVVYRADFVSGNLSKAAYQFTFTETNGGYTIGANKPDHYLTHEVVDATYTNGDSCTAYVLRQEAEIFNIAPVEGASGSYHIWVGEAGGEVEPSTPVESTEPEQPSTPVETAGPTEPVETDKPGQPASAFKAQLGSDANFNGDIVELSNALYTFTANGAAYTVSNGDVYLNIVAGKNAYPNGSNAGLVAKVEFYNGQFFISNNQGR